MPVSLSIKAAPDALVEKLRRRAAGNHRSLQRELMAIVEAALQPVPRAIATMQLPAAMLRVAEPEPAWQPALNTGGDGLLEELDTIVSGSRFGEAPLLTREQAHDRAVAREIDFDSRQADGKAAARSAGGT